MATEKEKRTALQLAYQILTDNRNTNKYSMSGIWNMKTMELFEYIDMLRVLREMYAEVNEDERDSV